MIALLLFLTANAFMFRKVILHWRYLKISENSYKGYDSYLASVFSFDFKYFGDNFRVLLPFFKRHAKENDDPALKALGSKLRKSLILFWSFFGGTIAFMIIGVLILSSTPDVDYSVPNYMYISAHEFNDKDHAERLTEASEPKHLNFSDGVHTEWNNYDEPIQRGNFKDGVLHGEFNQWNESGVLIEASEYRDGYPHGLTRYYYPNGALNFEVMYRRGLRHGPGKMYYLDGSIYEECSWNEGRPDGTCTVYYQNGQTKIVGEYDMGTPVTEFQFFDETGVLIE